MAETCCWAEKRPFVVCWGCRVRKGRGSEKGELTCVLSSPLAASDPQHAWKVKTQVTSHISTCRTVGFNQESERSVLYPWFCHKFHSCLWARYSTYLHLGFHSCKCKNKVLCVCISLAPVLIIISKYIIIAPEAAGFALLCSNNASLSVSQLEFLKKS